jgi:hypothetical protein
LRKDLCQCENESNSSTNKQPIIKWLFKNGRFKVQTSVGHFFDFVINSGSQAFEIFERASGFWLWVS